MKKKYSIAIITAMILMGLAACEEVKEIIDPEDPVDEKIEMIIGHGYDITGSYAVSEDIQSAILNCELLNKDGKLKEDVSIENSFFEIVSGTSVSELQKNLAVRAGISGEHRFFSGEVKVNYEKEQYQQENTSFSTVQGIIQKEAWFLNNRKEIEELKSEYLDETFNERINDENFEPSRLFELYGTHCILGAIYGARFDYSFTASRLQSNSSTSLGAYAQIKYRSLTLAATVNAERESEALEGFDKNSIVEKTKVVGGSSQLGVNIIQKQDYDTWTATIDNNVVFMDYYKDGLLPIWNFCDDDSRMKSIEEAFYTYLASTQIDDPLLTKITFSVERVNIKDVDDKNNGQGDFLYAFLIKDNKEKTTWNYLNPNTEVNENLINDANKWSAFSILNNKDSTWQISKGGNKDCDLSNFEELSTSLNIDELEDEVVYFEFKTFVEESDGGNIGYKYNEKSINGEITEITGKQLKDKIEEYTITGEAGSDNKTTVTYKVTFE